MYIHGPCAASHGCEVTPSHECMDGGCVGRGRNKDRHTHAYVRTAVLIWSVGPTVTHARCPYLRLRTYGQAAEYLSHKRESAPYPFRMHVRTKTWKLCAPPHDRLHCRRPSTALLSFRSRMIRRGAPVARRLAKKPAPSAPSTDWQAKLAQNAQALPKQKEITNEKAPVEPLLSLSMRLRHPWAQAYASRHA